ncbi:hypothetical protein HG535_0E01860 [Zygotorulaspora mrakii]|uniref:Uncharacterized protein n=1 Tax=Zygotorulaspora mrakii TaxID=42260 RepID=A0A7H9B5Q9_ZYGMR|nr:uncharacterized protein HG535_0E01860 [Zygotorulaspora mrakii]QLG73102.1 hypothetical protein HG535_0E01860 [Zygotorulaspora mrakii]
MSTNALQAEQVRTKVLYSEVDTPFNGYLDILSKVTKLSNQILKGQLQKYETESKVQFGETYINELEQTSDLKFLELQNSLEVKKVSEENWEQSGNDTLEKMKDQLKFKVPELKSSYEMLQDRISRIRVIYESVSKVNSEMEILMESNTSLTTSKNDWEEALGATLAEKLIKQRYLKKVGKSIEGEEELYRVYDNFTKGPKEMKHVNKSIKADIDRLSQELRVNKDKWLKDAEIFTRMTSILREELAKRDMDVDVDMDEEEDQEGERERYRRQRAVDNDREDQEVEDLEDLEDLEDQEDQEDQEEVEDLEDQEDQEDQEVEDQEVDQEPEDQEPEDQEPEDQAPEDQEPEDQEPEDQEVEKAENQVQVEGEDAKEVKTEDQEGAADEQGDGDVAMDYVETKDTQSHNSAGTTPGTQQRDI